MATAKSDSTSPIIEIAEVPFIYQQANNHDFALKLDQQHLVLYQSINPPMSHQFDCVVQKWSVKTDDDIHYTLAAQRNFNISDITRDKILRYIPNPGPRDSRTHILPVPSKGMVLVFYEYHIGRFDLKTEEFESICIGREEGIAQMMMKFASVALSSDKDYVMMINLVIDDTLDTRMAFPLRMGIHILDIRNTNEYSICTVEEHIDRLFPQEPERRVSWRDFDFLLLGSTNNSAFVRKWMDNMLKQQEYKDMDIAEVIIFLIGRYYAERMMHLLWTEHDVPDERPRHWMISEKDILKPMVNGIGTRFKWPKKDDTTLMRCYSCDLIKRNVNAQ